MADPTAAGRATIATLGRPVRTASRKGLITPHSISTAPHARSQTGKPMGAQSDACG